MCVRALSACCTTAGIDRARADRGLPIDEFDKMNEQDRTSTHVGMGQQVGSSSRMTRVCVTHAYTATAPLLCARHQRRRVQELRIVIS